ncbi:MAG: hypothetical protein ACRYFS_20890 [Janthinobacterium lividum]
MPALEPYGCDRSLSDDANEERDEDKRDDNGYDLAVLNLHLFLDTFRQHNTALRCRILAHWETFQSLLDFGEPGPQLEEQDYDLG